MLSRLRPDVDANSRDYAAELSLLTSQGLWEIDDGITHGPVVSRLFSKTKPPEQKQFLPTPIQIEVAPDPAPTGVDTEADLIAIRQLLALEN